MIHSVGHSERTGVVVEPRLSTQWFVKMGPLAKEAIDNQSTDQAVEFFPPRFNQTFLRWMENIHDWVISRQLWWGHQIPAWYHNETGGKVCGLRSTGRCRNWTQDPDVLDTWFSPHYGHFQPWASQMKIVLIISVISQPTHASHRLRHHCFLGKPHDFPKLGIHRQTSF